MLSSLSSQQDAGVGMMILIRRGERMLEKLFGAANRAYLDKRFSYTVFRYPRYPTPTKAGIWAGGYLLRGQVVVFVNKPYPRFVLRPPFLPARPFYCKEGRQPQNHGLVCSFRRSPVATSTPIPRKIARKRRQHPPPAFPNYRCPKFSTRIKH